MGATDPRERRMEAEKVIAYTCQGCGSRGVNPSKTKKGNYLCPECGNQVEASEKRVVPKKKDK